MIIAFPQIDAIRQNIKDPKNILGKRVNYQFNFLNDNGATGICGIYGWVIEWKNPNEITARMDLTIAFESTVPGFFITEEVSAARSGLDILPDAESITEWENYAEIENILCND